MKLPELPKTPRLVCGECGASMYKCGETGSHVRYRCLSGKHTWTQLKSARFRANTRNNPPPNDAA